MLGKESNRGVTKKYVVYVVNVAFLECLFLILVYSFWLLLNCLC